MFDTYYSNSDYSINYLHSKTDHNEAADFHLHNRFEVYFFISGNVNYFIEKKVYPLKYGDLFVMNSHEIHKPSFVGSKTYERIVVHFDPTIPQAFSAPCSDLLHCFLKRPIGEQNKIELSTEQIRDLLNIYQKIEHYQKDSSEFARVLKLTAFIELLVFINRAFIQSSRHDDRVNMPPKIAGILDYINQNLENDLSLGHLEKQFFLNPSYLSRLFKKSTGSNLHQYIIYKRISKAKKLLSEGHNASDTCFMCGFNDFSNFSRIFKRTVGISLREFKREVRSGIYVDKELPS